MSNLDQLFRSHTGDHDGRDWCSLTVYDPLSKAVRVRYSRFGSVEFRDFWLGQTVSHYRVGLGQKEVRDAVLLGANSSAWSDLSFSRPRLER